MSIQAKERSDDEGNKVTEELNIRPLIQTAQV